jgi:succinate-semialdehyde dehydrogenase/glutarate-semialdehyde dehydrogenase
MCVLAERAGVPAGVVSIVTGDSKPIGGELTSNPIIRQVELHGLDGGGQAADGAVLVDGQEGFAGARRPTRRSSYSTMQIWKLQVAGAVASKYRNAGQTCVCANRIFVQAGIYDRFAQRLAEVGVELRFGNGLDKDTKIGPLIEEKAVAKVEEHVRDAVAKGAKIVTGGKRGEGAGHFYVPTVLTGIRADTLVMHEETFGPVAPLMKFDTEEEVLRLANATEVRPRQLLLYSRRRPCVAGRRGPGKRHRRHQRRHHLHRGGRRSAA